MKACFVPTGRIGIAFVFECSPSEMFEHLVILHAGTERPLHFCVIEELNVKTVIEGIMYFVCQKWFSNEQGRCKKEQRILRGRLSPSLSPVAKCSKMYLSYFLLHKGLKYRLATSGL